MIGTYDFPGHYEWTFDWIERVGGTADLRDYWREAISRDSQRHARTLIEHGGFAGMAKYWGHTLNEESPDQGFTITPRDGVFRIDIHDCPSKGFLIRNGLAQHRDYCDHCIGWIGPLMHDAGFVVDHEHNHRGQCWWEMRRPNKQTQASARRADKDVTARPDWRAPGAVVDGFRAAGGAEDKLP